MEANDNREGLGFEARRALLARLVANLAPGAEGRASAGAIIRELEQMRPGLVDQAHARLTAQRLGLAMRTRPDAALPDLSFLDYAGA